MKLSEVYLKVAGQKLDVLNNGRFEVLNLSQRAHEKMCDFFDHSQDSCGDPENNQETTVLALCFMAAIAEDEERSRKRHS